MTNDPQGVKKAVKASRFFPVHKELSGLYDDNDISATMRTFLAYFMPSMGDYYQITPGWAKVRSLWIAALQSIARENDIKEVLTKCNNEANDMAEETSSSDSD